MLLDTSGLLCLHYPAEPFHTQAVSAYKRAASLLTHNYVLAEYVALAHARKCDRSLALEFMTDLMDNPEIEVVWVDKALHQSAFQLLRDRQDKDYSLCDAVSFRLMSQRKVSEALTTDKHFEQAGFIRLLNL
ncbi:MAG: PIN domain-containing protein [Cyanobacteria bacterium P01_D01_bin.36]|mgnify:CR=1 FL=1